MKRHPTFAAVAFMILSLAARAAEMPPASAAEPNIVLIISDDHAWTDYGFMGHPTIETPRLDRLASESLVYRRGHVPSSLCCPSLASMITGLYPHQHRITSNDPPVPPGAKRQAFYQSAAFAEGREVMNRHLEAVPTLPRRLADLGYLSLQTGKWWQGDYRRGGFTHGMTRGQRHGDEGLDIGRKTMQPIYDFIAEAKRQQRPFFVWYAPMLPHDPHTPPERLLEKYRSKTHSLHVARYWAMVEWFDETCGALVDHIDQQGLKENTIILYVADNGWIQNPDAAGPVRSKTTPYESGLRTPIMIRFPGKVEPRMSDEPAMSIDLVPTLLAALGQPRDASLPGIDLLDAAAVQARPSICGACFTHNAVDLNDPAKNVMYRWIIERDQKLIVPDREARGGSIELYNVAADPGEERDLAANQPETVARLHAALDAWWKP